MARLTTEMGHHFLCPAGEERVLIPASSLVAICDVRGSIVRF